MEYKIAKGTITSMTQQVLKLLNEGWTLQGGVSVTVDQEGFQIFAQAMIREE